MQTHETHHKHGGTIAVIEDDSDLRNLVMGQLRRSGYEVVGLRDGRAAAEYIADSEIRGSRPAAIVSDIRMPGFSGIALLEAIRQAGWTTPVILMTGFGITDGDAIERLDAAAVLAKPFPTEELEELLDAVVGVPFGLQSSGVS